MKRTCLLYQVDSFTKEKFSGNPAGVVLGAEVLSEGEMQRIARELNNSETAFVLPPEGPGHDVHLRFFTPSREVPLCGHATIAAHYVLASANKWKNCRLLQKTGAGILPVDIVREKDYRIVMTQGPIVFEEPLGGETVEAITAALGLSKRELRENCPVQIVSTGHSKVMLSIRDEKLLHRLSPDMRALKHLSAAINCNGYYVFTQGRANSSPLIHGRMFAPVSGVNEDPVTGNASGPLGAYLIRHNLVEHNGSSFQFQARQGEAIGRPGTVDILVSIENNEPAAVSISGHAVIAFATQLTL